MSNNRVVIKLQLNTTHPVLTVNEYELSLECGIADLLKWLDQSMDFIVAELNDNGFLDGIKESCEEEYRREGYDYAIEELREEADTNGPRIGIIADSPEDINSALSSKQCRALCAYLIKEGYRPEEGGK